MSRKQHAKPPESDMNFATQLEQEVRDDPIYAANAVVRLSKKLCENNQGMPQLFDALEKLQDGKEMGRIANKSPESCQPLAQLMKDAFILPVAMKELFSLGAMLVIPKSAIPRSKLAKLDREAVTIGDQSPTQNTRHSAGWPYAAENADQISALALFQETTDKKSPYGQLIIFLCNLVLEELQAQEPNSTS